MHDFKINDIVENSPKWPDKKGRVFKIIGHSNDGRCLRVRVIGKNTIHVFHHEFLQIKEKHKTQTESLLEGKRWLKL